jgi:uncharacterized protein (TIGR03435 family)
MNLRKKNCVVITAAACARFILSVCTAAEPKAGDPPPPLGLETILQAPSGAEPSWNALKGKVVVLEFWATWCGPCVAAIPHLNELADKLKDEPIQFIAITAEDEKVVGPFLRRKPIHAWVGLDTDKSMFDDYGVTSIPHTVIVDQKGMIAAITHPTFLTEGLLREVLAGKKVTLAQPAISKKEPEALLQVVVRPSKTAGGSSTVSNKGSLTLTGATVLDVLSSSYSINPARILNSSALPEGPFDFTVKTPDTGNDTVQTWLRQAVAVTFGVTARPETKEMDAFVLKTGQLTEHLAPTVSTGGSSMSSGGGSLNCVSQSMSSLAWSLEAILKKPVIDETSLTNRYDFQLLWNEKESGETDPVELRRALHEQLGLELEPTRRVVEVLAVTVADRRAGQADYRGRE